nr:MAG TPA: hypothetical protein [Caudoviricetes sp.]
MGSRAQRLFLTFFRILLSLKCSWYTRFSGNSSRFESCRVYLPSGTQDGTPP